LAAAKAYALRQTGQASCALQRRIALRWMEVDAGRRSTRDVSYDLRIWKAGETR